MPAKKFVARHCLSLVFAFRFFRVTRLACKCRFSPTGFAVARKARLGAVGRRFRQGVSQSTASPLAGKAMCRLDCQKGRGQAGQRHHSAIRDGCSCRRRLAEPRHHGHKLIHDQRPWADAQPAVQPHPVGGKRRRMLASGLLVRRPVGQPWHEGRYQGRRSLPSCKPCPSIASHRSSIT